MIDKDKLQAIFRTFISLILEYQDVNYRLISQMSEKLVTNHSIFLNNIINLNKQFSNYQLRPNYDQDQEYIERINLQKQELEKQKIITKRLKKDFEFVVGQTKLDMDKLNEIIEDLKFMIVDL